MCNFFIYAILSYYTAIDTPDYTYILDITMTVGIFRTTYKCNEI